MATQKIDVLALGRSNLTDNSNAAIFFEANNIVALWSSGTTYAQYNVVEYSGAVYRSKVASNLANTPNTSPSQWETLYIGPKDGDVAVVVNGASSNIIQRIASIWAPTNPIPLTITLMDNQPTFTDIFTWVGGTKTVALIDYVLKRGIVAGRFRRGKMNVLNDGSSTVDYDHEFNSTGVDVNAFVKNVMVGANVHFQYTSGNDGNPLAVTLRFTGYSP